MRQNVAVRKMLIGAISTVVAVVVGAVGTDFGAAIYAEYRLARSVRTANHLDFDPWVSILGFPFATQARAHRYQELEIRAAGVDHPVTGKVSLEATLHDIDITDTGWLIGPDARLPVGKVESRIILDSTHIGRYIGMKDLLVEAPTRETEDGSPGVTESGISSGQDLVFTGTPDGLDKRVSVAVDLSLADPGDTTLVMTPTGVLTGPGTADESVPEEKTAEVLDAFAGRIPGQRLPFGLQPTTAGARGSDLIIEGIAEGLTIDLDGFRQS
ncbi:mannan chain length control protein LmeA [Mycolicibacterium sp. A43C]